VHEQLLHSGPANDRLLELMRLPVDFDPNVHLTNI
jgi:hypothetical protein